VSAAVFSNTSARNERRVETPSVVFGFRQRGTKSRDVLFVVSSATCVEFLQPQICSFLRRKVAF